MPLDSMNAVIGAVVAGAPEWVRNDLSSRESAVRARAEDAVAAMIANALAEAGFGSAAASER
jgi:hypothetical protein